MENMDRQTIFSKTSIQMVDYLDFIEQQKSVPLNHTQLSNFSLFEAPLVDKEDLKRVVLFSDNPLEEVSS